MAMGRLARKSHQGAGFWARDRARHGGSRKETKSHVSQPLQSTDHPSRVLANGSQGLTRDLPSVEVH